MDAPALAVTGVTGGVGSRLAARLAADGVSQRVIVRDPARAPSLPGATVVAAEYDDAAAFGRALRGVETLFLVSLHEARARVEQHRRAIEAAVDAGVRRIVYTSFLSAAADATFTFARDHAATEDLLRASGVAWTALRNSLYQDVVPHFVGDDGAIRGPAGDGRVSFVSRDDIAAVAAALLTGDGTAPTTLDVTGPGALTFHEAADALTRVTGREVRYVPETLEEARASRAPSGAPAWEIEGWVTSYHAATTGELAIVSDTVERYTGRPPVALEDWLRANPAAWAHLVPA